MRQLFILLSIFICSSALADHAGASGYNDRTFPCPNFREAKEWAETDGGGGNYYNFGLCELHRGHLIPGISTLKQAAAMGDPYAAIEVSEYYASDGYDLPEGETTYNEANLKKTIEYDMKALQIIRRSNYPYDDPYGDHLRIEKWYHPYLNTASNLVGNYISLFAARISRHIESINQDIGNATLEPLKNAIEEANRCLSIPYNSDLWSEGVYNNKMALCRENKKLAEVLLPLERERLRISKANCKNIRLSDCEAHNRVEGKIYQFYSESVDVSAKLLSSM